MRRWCVRLAVLLPAFFAALIAGCTAGYRLTDWSSGFDTTATANDLRQVLDRWVGWRSLSARVKLTVVSGDTSFTARGHLMYLMGERYQLGFARPFDRFLGTFYFTPEQIVYWDLGFGPKVFNRSDSIALADLVPIAFPDWNPRDLLPFPVSARSGGFQATEFKASRNGVVISGGDGTVIHDLTISQRAIPQKELVRRAGYSPMHKRFDRTTLIDGWPVSKRVVCSDNSGHYRLVWRLSDIRLVAAPFRLDSDSAVSLRRRSNYEP